MPKGERISVWKEPVEKRFSWAKMEREVEKLLYELVKAEEEEDTGIYLLMMHYDHARDEKTFTKAENERILHSLSLLIGDSRKHQKLLLDAIEKLENKGIEK